MKAIMGTVHNGQIVADQPVEWPEGFRVIIEPAAKEEPLGIREEDWPTDPEGISRLLALMDQIEPLEMTPQEEAAWEAERKARKEWEKANFDKRSRKLEELFE
ncbi:MAG: hypothetical protein ACYC3I_20955 [Gemmataceae bacterium]